MALREIPFGRIRPTPRYLDVTFENSLDRTRDDWIVEYERHGVPIRDILTGRMRITRFRRCGQLQTAITIMTVFIDMKENWTRRAEGFKKMEENFATNLFNILVYVKRNIDWRVGGRPPIDRDHYELLKQCCAYEPFKTYWSSRKKRRAVVYLNIICFYFDTVNLELQEEMHHHILMDDVLEYSEER